MQQEFVQELIQEMVGGEGYAYYPLGEYVVSAPAVCNGRPTFKYTRIEATGALNLIAAGYTMAQIAQRFDVPQQAVEEAVRFTATEENQNAPGIEVHHSHL